MGFTYTISEYGVRGARKFRRGTYTSAAGSTGGDINTGLTICEHMNLQPTGGSVSASDPVVNETFPVAGTAVTIVTVANEVGNWEATGY